MSQVISNQEKYLESRFSKEKKYNWRTIAYFKNSGLMIRGNLVDKSIYLSFIEKPNKHVNKYQKFDEGLVIKLDIHQINELLFYIDKKVNYSTWREKGDKKYNISMSILQNEQFTLADKRQIRLVNEPFRLAVFDLSVKKEIHSFILSPFEKDYIIDYLKEFRKSVIKGMVIGRDPSN